MYLERNKIINIYGIQKDIVLRIETIIEGYLEKIKYLDIDKIKYADAIGMLTVIVEIYPLINDKNFWNEFGYKLMEIIRECILTGNIQSVGLCQGLSNIGVIIKRYSDCTGFYKRFLQKFQLFFRNVVDHHLCNVQEHCVNTRDFDVISGFSGVLHYLLEYNDYDEELVQKIVLYLCSITDYKTYENAKIPGWYIDGYHQMTDEDTICFPDGQINFGFAHGISGVLSALIKAAKKGVCVNRINVAIDIIVSELEKVQRYDENGLLCFPGMLDVNDYIKGKFISVNKRMSWCYGSVAILYALYNAYEYKNDDIACQKIEIEFVKIINVGVQNWKLESPILCHGYAGTAHIFLLMYKKCNNFKMKKVCEELLNNIIKCYNSKYTYGFKDILYKDIQGRFEKVYEDKNTFLEGAPGIIIELLSYIKEQEMVSLLLGLD